MKKAAIIAVGSELMRGKMDDTNSTYLARWLFDRSISVVMRMNAPDTIEGIVDALKNSSGADVVICTGGLGPTDDDLTRDALAAYLGTKLVFDDEMWVYIESLFNNRGVTIYNSNKRQAFCLEGGEFLRNKHGTAPGVYINKNGMIYILLPGPPKENRPMIENEMAPKLLKDLNIKERLFKTVYRVYGTGESRIADLFENEKTDLEVGYYFTADGYIELHFIKNITDDSQIEGYRKSIKHFTDLLDREDIFYTDDIDLELALFNILQKNGKTISFAESITGGAMSGKLVKVPGASVVLSGGVTAYSNEIKESVLKVSSKTLQKYGAVSEETVREMAAGCKKIFKTDISVAVSGIAGPDGGSESKPVGLVHIGIDIDGKSSFYKNVFYGDRLGIINRTIIFVYEHIIRELQ